jgi:hypothetical protein
MEMIRQPLYKTEKENRRELADRIEVKNQMIAEQGHPEGNRQQRRLAARMERKRRQREGV